MVLPSRGGVRLGDICCMANLCFLLLHSSSIPRSGYFVNRFGRRRDSSIPMLREQIGRRRETLVPVFFSGEATGVGEISYRAWSPRTVAFEIAIYGRRTIFTTDDGRQRLRLAAAAALVLSEANRGRR
ncbi:hypothetical protein L484_018662 [Morus notabilis]|uniref:Uncharacterized protein n=1 Tax=Morus notabilis TaxID=981085 RepID=W9S778_9ROSA|nr:hypothetical protein L484_018662 [Morus notabilis]